MTEMQKTWVIPSAGSLRLFAIVMVLIGLLSVIATLALDVRSNLSLLARGDSENGQWVMMQTEVEVLRLQYAIAEAAHDELPLAEVRRWFDVVYSRVRMLDQGPLYASFLNRPENAQTLAILGSFAAKWVPAMDGEDATLRSALRDMLAEVTALQKEVRMMSLNALVDLSSQSDERRARMSGTLVRLGLTTGATMLLLALVASILAQLYRTTRRQAEENVVTGTRLQMIVATSPDAIVVTNRGGWVVEFNPAAEAMFGLARDEILGRPGLPLLFPAEHHAEYQALISKAIARALTSGPQRFEVEGLRQNGERFPVELSIAIRDLRQGSLVVAFMRDVSARKASNTALQEALTKAQAGERAKERFLAVMSHEMRTPLNGLMGSIDLLQHSDLTPDQRELLRIIEVSGDMLLGHVSSVLDVALWEAGEIRLSNTIFDLDQLIDDCIANQAELARAAGNTVRRIALGDPIGLVQGDPARLRQILLNLIGNAVKFTRDGTISVETERMTARAAEGQGDCIELRVADTGIGIAAQDLDRVFEDFETLDSGYDRNAGGTGLGLGISRRLAHAMGGEIGVESEAGAGSVFWVRLPLPAAPASVATDAPKTKASPVALARPAAPLKVLIVEDNAINRLLLRRYLEDVGHKVTEAVDGLKAVELARKTRFDVILTDISMPGLDGIEATRRIRAGKGASAKAPIIALTAHALPEELQHFRSAGIQSCMIKPVTRAAVLSHLANPEAPFAPIEACAPEVSPLLDPQPLADMIEGLGHPHTQALVARMLGEGDDVMARLAQMPVPGDVSATLAHKFAGICAAYGALRLRDLLAVLEQSVRAGQTDAALHALSQLPEIWEQTRTALDAAITPKVA